MLSHIREKETFKMFNTENIVKKNQQLNGSISAVYGTLRFEKQGKLFI